MNDSLPEPETDEVRTLNKRSVGIMVAIGVVVLAALSYGFYRAMPNFGGGVDIASFKTGTLADLELKTEAPLQPVASFFNAAGQPTNLAAFRGKVVLLNLWATWCAPCVAEMPTLGDLQAKYADQDFAVIAISVDRDDTRAEAVSKLDALAKGKLAFFHDPKMAVVFPLKARGFPTSVLYDRNGKEIARLAGEADWNSPEAHGLIEAALAQN
jgi:thiol-disulfide isomerase/thioredoxin